MSITRRPAWLVASAAAVCLLAARLVWLAWSYYFGGAPRYPVESAAIALVAVGTLVVLLRPGGQMPAPIGVARLSVAWLPMCLGAAVALYAPVLRLGLLSDDFVLRAMARAGDVGGNPGWFFRPVPLLVWRFLYALSDSPVALHTLNILLHGLNAFLVGVLGVRMGMPRAAALAGAALFLTFPAAPEAVAWASGIQDVLLTTLALGAVTVAGGGGPSGWRITSACALLALALGSKETAVCVPALVAICWLAPPRMRQLNEWRPYLALIAVAAVYSLFRVWIGIGSGYLAAPSRYFFKQLMSLAFGTLATPWRSPASRPAQWLAFVAVVSLALLLTHAFLVWRRTDDSFRRTARLALWVLAAVSPVFTYFFVSPRLEGARYLYLAEAGWALLVAELIRTATDRVRPRALAFACISGAAVVTSSVTLQRELVIWRRAADMRDRVLVEARTSIINARCVEAHFDGVPDSVEGAYVFRNGFPEAMGFSEGEATRATGGCRFTWNGNQFVPSTVLNK